MGQTREKGGSGCTLTEEPPTTREVMSLTSRFHDELCQLLGQASLWSDVRHLKTLVWMVIGLICSGCISLTQWGVYIDSRAEFAQSRQRRLSRWLHNPRINVHKLYSPLIAWALCQWGNEEMVLLLDSTVLWDLLLCGARECAVSGKSCACGVAGAGAGECQR